ncbi:MAG: hypothetical protein GY865_04030 [candidate division Zixibacteria bacterium]|nr:hypothetical protein [candidate division Zixibacteria bacterium]
MRISSYHRNVLNDRRNFYNELFLTIAGLLFIALLFPINAQTENSVELFWSAPGDDYSLGRGANYDIRYSSFPIGSDTISWWNSATKVSLSPDPSWNGRQDSCTIYNLSLNNSYYFAIKTSDESNNWSGISNIAEIPPLFCVDISGDGSMDILDAIYLLNFIYRNGAPLPSGIDGDIDNSGEINILDAILIIGFCYKDAALPGC